MSAFSVTLPSGETWTPTFVQSIDEEKCIGCGRCFKVCPRGVLAMVVDSPGKATQVRSFDEIEAVGGGRCLRLRGHA